MKAKLKAIVTITQEYEADSKFYFNVTTAKEMIQIDKKNFENDELLFIDGMIENGGTAEIKITEVKR